MIPAFSELDIYYMLMYCRGIKFSGIDLHYNYATFIYLFQFDKYSLPTPSASYSFEGTRFEMAFQIIFCSISFTAWIRALHIGKLA